MRQFSITVVFPNYSETNTLCLVQHGTEKQTPGTRCWVSNSRLVIQSIIFFSPCLTSNISKTTCTSSVLFTQCHLIHCHVSKGIGFKLARHKIWAPNSNVHGPITANKSGELMWLNQSFFYFFACISVCIYVFMYFSIKLPHSYSKLWVKALSSDGLT